MNIKNIGKLVLLVIVAASILTFSRYYTENNSVDTTRQSPQIHAIPLPVLPIGSAEADTDSITTWNIGGNHIRGHQNATIYLIEFSDMDCPYCHKFHSTVLELLAKRTDVAWVYKQFPLTNLHPEAKYKSLLAECVARDLGEEKFWEFTDRVLASEPTLRVLNQIGATNAANCAEEPSIQAIVDADIQLGTSLGAQGTPFVILQTIDGKTATLPGAVSIKVIEQEIEKLLTK